MSTAPIPIPSDPSDSLPLPLPLIRPSYVKDLARIQDLRSGTSTPEAHAELIGQYQDALRLIAQGAAVLQQGTGSWMKK
jgi:hypothetical protein